MYPFIYLSSTLISILEELMFVNFVSLVLLQFVGFTDYFTSNSNKSCKILIILIFISISFLYLSNHPMVTSLLHLFHFAIFPFSYFITFTKTLLPPCLATHLPSSLPCYLLSLLLSFLPPPPPSFFPPTPFSFPSFPFFSITCAISSWP